MKQVSLDNSLELLEEYRGSGSSVFTKRFQSAILISSLGEPLEVHDNHPIPNLDEFEVLIENKAIGLNPVDWKSKKYGFSIYSFPWVNGRESSGVIVKQGDRVTEDLIGKKVFLASTSYRDNRTSTFQEYTVMDSRLVWELPEKLSFEEGATLGVGLVTAGALLYDSFGIDFADRESNLGKSIVIWGGSSVVGIYATQLASIAGFSVISVASRRNQKLLESLGASLVVDRHQNPSAIFQQTLELAPNGLDFGIDCVSKETSLNVVDLLKLSFDISGKVAKFAGIVGVPRTIPWEVEPVEVTIKRFHENVEYGEMFVRNTSMLLHEGTLKPVRQKKFFGGIEMIIAGLEDLESFGASAEKYVVSI
ncbi:hypothetical protein BABINDRAFT_35064 [Babjeviella inositovora NRRL Y-12698]|uniref:Enoyl reductase (ER) domain-containing protein n=1 Tax=Babjeviella inositovora NRRL Y-12698 TaxID=984486 RepID=A0A1E3QT93_9ASCO|nr:uncharacterized protein BABINDRAFT_35064 [Babjeviella inositovora NRRL Y-12698]ODQ80890.1 hypothetical protein BABINDRAFT_35064 [Babjeviella inositovora NRRL Y-12698]